MSGMQSVFGAMNKAGKDVGRRDVAKEKRRQAFERLVGHAFPALEAFAEAWEDQSRRLRMIRPS